MSRWRACGQRRSFSGSRQSHGKARWIYLGKFGLSSERVRKPFTGQRLVRSLLVRRGFGTEEDAQQADPVSRDDLGMAALLANSIRRRIAVGSNTGRGVVRLERLCRYAARPAVATERLTELPDGRLLYRLKRPSRD